MELLLPLVELLEQEGLLELALSPRLDAQPSAKSWTCGLTKVPPLARAACQCHYTQAVPASGLEQAVVAEVATWYVALAHS